MIQIRFFAERNYAQRRVDFYLGGFDRQADSVFQAEPITMKKVNPAEISVPTFSLTDDGCQAFIDQLWSNGFRPSKSDNQGAMDAQSKHLDDMRKIAFMFLEKGNK